MPRPALIVILLALCVATRPTLLCADEAPYARTCLDRLHDGLEQIDAQMSLVSEAAERAAAAMDKGHGFGVRGDDGLANELSNRAGAMMGYDGRRGEPGDVILYAFTGVGSPQTDASAPLTRQAREVARLRAAGSVVIGIGYGSDTARQACDVFIEGGTLGRKPEGQTGEGLNAFEDDGTPIPTAMNAAAAWAFECELFAAFTRLDKVPVVRQSFEIDTRHRRWLRYGSQRFHHDRWLDPIPAGVLGHAYLNELRGVLRDVGTASWRHLTRAADRAESTLDAGGLVWLRAGGRGLPYHAIDLASAYPGVFTLLTHDGSNPKLPAPGRNDFVIAVGRYETAGSWEWGEPELLRQAGRGVAWIVNGYNSQPGDLDRGELLVDLWGPVGDTVVTVKDYDASLGPVSSVIAEAVTWMIAAEVSGRMHDHAATGNPRR